jgi:hypothetical protein
VAIVYCDWVEGQMWRCTVGPATDGYASLQTILFGVLFQGLGLTVVARLSLALNPWP